MKISLGQYLIFIGLIIAAFLIFSDFDARKKTHLVETNKTEVDQDENVDTVIEERMS